MLKNYLKIAWRDMKKNKVFSFINIMGLTVGMTACFLIFLYIKFELGYDKFHSNADRIYRIVCDIKTPTEVLNAGGPSWAVPPNVKDEFPEVEAFVRVNNTSFIAKKGDVQFQEDNCAFVDSAFFQVFDFSLVKGDKQTALKEPFSIVLTETSAKKYFGNTDPIGQTLLIDEEELTATVTGVMADMPENTRLKADMLVSMSTLTQKLNPKLDEQWGNYGAQAYLLLNPGSDAGALQKKFPDFLEKRNGSEMKQSQMYATLFLEPLKDVYLYSTRNGSNTGNINNVYIFSMVAVFILLIASFNFINLTTARSTERAKEVGIRKVVGAAKSQLTKQFIGDSLLLCLIAFLFTVGLSVLMLPLFNQLAGKPVSTGVFSNVGYIGILLVAAICIGLLAGIYPALVLSAFKPVTVLKGRFATGTKGIFLRKGLVIAQFTISVALIFGTIIVYNQMQYMRNQDLGFSKDQMLVVDTKGSPSKEAFRQALTGIPAVKSSALSGSVPGGGNPGAYSEIENITGDLQIANLDLYFVDFDYIDQYQIKMLAGRGFSRDFGTDSTQAMVMNEAAVKLFGYSSPEEAIGKRFKQWGREGTIIGVMKDFHFRGLQGKIEPLTMRIEPEALNLVSIHVSTANMPATIAAIEKEWKATVGNQPFNYFFLDEYFNRQYRSEEQFGRLFLNFAILAIFISCLGLFGLASYSTAQRVKEIGIRKVLGASVPNIVRMLSSDFMKLVLIAIGIALPFAWWVMHRWLADFAYQTDISWWMFAVAGLTAVVIALATVSWQAIKAAVTNPVDSLRDE
ncbi:ABC transporter permease [Parapedobacter tibetensis]|uniref:ABC transporter permease n=1 Tax=Parapedobacter tibetensis TaxID=2972951 RepID=UPI00214D863B|nr:ABC transporter permease [Parapedobacter tibetensis]